MTTAIVVNIILAAFVLGVIARPARMGDQDAVAGPARQGSRPGVAERRSRPNGGSSRLSAGGSPIDASGLQVGLRRTPSGAGVSAALVASSPPSAPKRASSSP